MFNLFYQPKKKKKNERKKKLFYHLSTKKSCVIREVKTKMFCNYNKLV